jgi:hypothetical protein
MTVLESPIPCIPTNPPVVSYYVIQTVPQSGTLWTFVDNNGGDVMFRYVVSNVKKTSAGNPPWELPPMGFSSFHTLFETPIEAHPSGTRISLRTYNESNYFYTYSVIRVELFAVSEEPRPAFRPIDELYHDGFQSELGQRPEECWSY